MANETFGSPMLGRIWTKTIRDHRRGLLWWSVALVATAFMYAGFYPSIRENTEVLTDYIETLPEFLKNTFLSESGDFTSPAGYLNTELFSFFAPLLLLIYAIGAGARATAGEEERRTLDILLATPTPRRRAVLEKFGALVIGTALLAAALWVSIAALGPPFELTPDLTNLAAAVVSCVLLAVSMGALALAVGASTGRRTLAAGVTGGVAALSYVLDVLAPSVESLRWLQTVSVFHYYAGNEPLTNGLDPLHVLVLVGVSAALLVAALVGFERRDLAA
ncbi:MAG TPA: ABC transporter permease subunit [Actinomycetota bacterium]